MGRGSFSKLAFSLVGVMVLHGAYGHTSAPAAETSAAAKKFEYEQQKDVVYGKGGGEELRLDLAKPKGLTEPAPAIVVIHGGGWAGGSKDDPIHTVLATEAAERGYVAININYRLAPQHRFPAQIEDCKCAVRWLRAHAKELQVDPTRIGAVGGSAGGHLVMMLGTMDAGDGLEGDGGWSDQSSKVQAVVSFFGPVNLIGDFPAISLQILDNFLGGDMKAKAADYRRASPLTYVNAGDAPMLLFQGTKDPLVPYDQAFQMVSSLDKAGVAARAEILVGAAHGWGDPDLARTKRETYEFFDEKLHPGGR